ncbi:MAG: hypothetical protein LUQ07_08005 [Methanospirillum sp.]|nr:hypothetical protein [Methanospirillum sp.]
MPAMKGAFVCYEDGMVLGLPNVILFQFNPESMTRSPSSHHASPENKATTKNTQAMSAVPTETVTFTLRFDATDQLACANPIAAAGGILPALSSLELLMQPIDDKSIPAKAAVQVPGPVSQPRKTPMVLFIWGMNRILPVTITSLSINETVFDTRLNPVRAEVTVTMEVVTPPTQNSFAAKAYNYSLGAKRVYAALNLANSAELLGAMF